MIKLRLKAVSDDYVNQTHMGETSGQFCLGKLGLCRSLNRIKLSSNI